MQLVASFARFVHAAARAVATPSRQNLLTALGGWLVAPRRTLTSCLVASSVAGARRADTREEDALGVDDPCFVRRKLRRLFHLPGRTAGRRTTGSETKF